MAAAEDNSLHAYVVISLVVGARTEELRALTWERVDLDGVPDADPPVPPSIQVWRSVREHGDTKTRKSRRTLALPIRGVSALRAHRSAQDARRAAAGEEWHDTDLVVTSKVGTALDAANVPPGGHGGRPGRRRLEPARAAAQLRLTAVGQRREPGGHRRPVRARRHDGHREGVPASTAAGPARRRDGDGPDLRSRRDPRMP
jgi:hypothetical protein